MTPEEKAKRYDEIFSTAKEWYNNPNSSSIGKSYLYAVFPELKESEGEKIRKAIIGGMTAIKNNQKKKTFADIPIDDCIAWLEKQGEQKLNGTFVNVDDVREDFIDEIYRVLNADSTNDRANQIIDAFDSLPTVTIKQDPCKHCKMTYSTCYSFPCDEKKAFEQGKTALEAINEEKVDNQFCVKPTNNVEPKFKVGDTMRTLQEASKGITSGLPVVVSIDDEYYHCNNELIAIKNQDDYEYPPMNKKHNAWREYDKERIKNILSVLDAQVCWDGATMEKRNPYQKEIDWLKSLKDRLVPQSKQEWSKEDETSIAVNNNLFKEVYFGKPYKTRDGRKALYCHKFTDNSHALIVEGDEKFWYVRDDGLVVDFDDILCDSSYYTDKDIVSEW